MNSFRTDLSRARGLGSIRSGTEHFWLSRVTGAANLLLLAFLVYSVFHLVGTPLAAVRDYFASPIVAALAALTAISWAYHMKIGMQVIIEDYVHNESTKILVLLLNTFFSALVGVTCIFAIIKLSLGA
jgi:succinate dehydrogenase / fumarate reductase, membrane anchor subunit